MATNAASAAGSAQRASLSRTCSGFTARTLPEAWSRPRPPPSSRSRPEPGRRTRPAESCGLAIVGQPGGGEAALRELDSLRREDALRIESRDSFACALGGAGWSGLGPERRHLFTVEAARRLVAQRDQVVRSARWRPLAGLAATWQTLLNSVTFGHNVALGALRGAPAMPAERPWQRRIDALASVVLALPALLIAIPVELAGGFSRRGAVVSLKLELF